MARGWLGSWSRPAWHGVRPAGSHRPCKPTPTLSPYRQPTHSDAADSDGDGCLFCVEVEGCGELQLASPLKWFVRLCANLMDLNIKIASMFPKPRNAKGRAKPSAKDVAQILPALERWIAVSAIPCRSRVTEAQIGAHARARARAHTYVHVHTLTQVHARPRDVCYKALPAVFASVTTVATGAAVIYGA